MEELFIYEVNHFNYFVNNLDYNLFSLEEIHFDSVLLRNAQEYLEFLLRPQSKHLKKLVLQNCSFNQTISSAQQIQSEMLEFFRNWKV